VNTYATPTNVSRKLQGELNQFLKVPVSVDVVTPATELLSTGGTFTSEYTDQQKKAALSLFQACLVANDTVDAALRKWYVLPLPMPEGATTQNDPLYYPALIGHAVNLVKWELLGGRSDSKFQEDSNDYDKAMAFLGMFGRSGEGKGKGQVGPAGDLTQGTEARSVHGASVVTVGSSLAAREKRETISNTEWVRCNRF
jgi:hypothetical protein